ALEDGHLAHPASPPAPGLGPTAQLARTAWGRKRLSPGLGPISRSMLAVWGRDQVLIEPGAGPAAARSSPARQPRPPRAREPGPRAAPPKTVATAAGPG